MISGESCLISEDGTRYRLGETNIIGRSGESTLVIHHESVSREHANIRYQAETESWVIRDLGSRNGTFIGNNRVINDTPLDSYSVVRFGMTSYTFVLEPDRHHQSSVATVTLTDLPKEPRENEIHGDFWIMLIDAGSSSKENRSHKLATHIRETLEPNEGIVIHVGADRLVALIPDKFDKRTIASIVRATQRDLIDKSFIKNFVLHYGAVTTSTTSEGEEPLLSGFPLQFVLSVHSTLTDRKETALFTENSATRLAEHLPFKALGEVPVPNFDMKSPIYTLT